MTAPAPAAHLTDADRTLAAEYVLGTLDLEERKRVRARIAADPPFAGLVRLWERRLSPLHELAVPVTPPPSIWRVIVADLKAAPPAAPKTLRKAPPAAEPAPRPVVGEMRPGRGPAPRPQGPVATIRRLFGLAVPGQGAGEGSRRPKRPVPAPAPAPAAAPVPVALRVPGGRTLGGAIQDAVAAGLLPPAPPLPEPPPQAPAPERADPLPPPPRQASPAPPRPRPVPEPLTPPPAFIFLEPDSPPAAEGPETGTGVDQAAPAPPAVDEGAPATAGPPSPPTFTLLEPAAPPAAGAPEITARTDPARPAPRTAGEGEAASDAPPPPAFALLEPVAPPVVHGPEATAADQSAPAPPSDEVTPSPAPSGSPGLRAPGVLDAEAIANPSPESPETVLVARSPDATIPPPAPSTAPRSPLAPVAEGGSGPQVAAELPSVVSPDGPQPDTSLETVPAPAAGPSAGRPAGLPAEPEIRPPSGVVGPAVAEGAPPDVRLAEVRAAGAPAPSAPAPSAQLPSAQPPSTQAHAEPSASESAPLQSTTPKAASVEPTVEPTPVETAAAEPPSADPAAGAKGEEAPPLPGWAAVVASGVVSALPDPAAAGDEPAPAAAVFVPQRRHALAWRTAALTLMALLIGVAAFAAYREWFWPRDGQWVGVLQSEPLPSIAVRLDPDSGVVFVRSFAPAPPDGDINRLWLVVPGRPALLLGAFTAGMSDRAPGLAGLGRNRLGRAEVVVTQGPKLGSGEASADGQPPGKVVYRGRLAPE